MKGFVHQFRFEQRLFWRNREAAIFVFLFPPLLYLLVAALYDGEIGGRPSADVLLAGLLGYACANTAFAGLAITQVVRREAGQLKRMRATPLAPATYVGAVVGSALLVYAVQMGFTTALGAAVYGASGPQAWGPLAAILVFGAVAFAGLGFGGAALIRSSEGASAVVNLVVLPMAFLSGSFGPTRDYPELLRLLAEVLPLTYLNRMLEAAYLDGISPLNDPVGLAVVAAWGLGGLFVAARAFSWSPHEA
ncbi:MAG: ABC transporter permease [Thermoleophilia bacterium]|nr:ABC transporter permease [Thermoleophilia bacterium]